MPLPAWVPSRWRWPNWPRRMGTRREDSVVGVSDSVGASVANAFDGKARQPEHVWYYVGGAALIVAGLVVATRKS